MMPTLLAPTSVEANSQFRFPKGTGRRACSTGLQGDKQQIPVAPAYRCGQVGHREQCGDLLALEEVDRAFGLALRRDGEHPLAMQQERRFADGDEAEEAPDCGSAHIACG